ncbi:neuroligin-2-like [Schistocerca serialis cubense]|uniref:neuroligin-2-like n=1 Tax=Schistocerca serialis cubense TaxID=2023355 RepID=UPI00214EF0E7|nr:neuroligin-2-like [Schistocerca serialis cubense]
MGLASTELGGSLLPSVFLYGIAKVHFNNTSVIIAIYMVVLVIHVSAGPRYSSRIVETRSGAIRGVILQLNSRHLEPVEAFLGVPYAAPATRFSPPQPPLAWQGTRLADTLGPVCPQRPPDISNRTAALLRMPRGRYLQLRRMLPLLRNQSEDCLFFNLYVPASGNRGLEAPYAVVVYIHGESFEWNSGNPYDGSVLASYGHVIVVTFNYRLGILGFLRTRSGPNAAGDLALQDAVSLLTWLRLNVAAFGGDPQRVTLLAHDTGAALAHLLLLLPAARGLVTRAVLLSGSALSPWASPSPARHDALRARVARLLGCDPGLPDVAPCLRAQPLAALLSVDVSPPRFLPRFGPSPDVPPGLATERAADPFVSCDLMLGVTSTESYLDFSAADIQYGFEEDERDRVLRTYIRNTYVYHLNEIFSAVRNEYTDWDKPILHPINIRDSTMEALSDGHTVSPVIRTAYLHSRRGARTYLFHFAYQTKDSDYPQRLGSVRGEDVSYVLGLPLVGGVPNFPQNFSRQDMGVAEAVLTFLTNFAKTGDPNEPREQNTDYGTPQEKTRYRALHWDAYETGNQQYLSLALKPRMKSHYRGHKMAIWLNLIPQLHQAGDGDVSMRHHNFHERDESYYSGVVRAESFTRLPTPQHVSTAASYSPAGAAGECAPNATGTAFPDDGDVDTVDPEDGLAGGDGGDGRLLATTQYSSYTAALGLTVGIGCLLLVLNVLIFAGIYWQRERRARRRAGAKDALPEDVPLAQLTPNVIKLEEPPPRYSPAHATATATAASSAKCVVPHIHKGGGTKLNAVPTSPPVPPLRTSSNPQPSAAATVKKRVHIQEISV